jgi:hydrogenase-4 component B
VAALGITYHEPVIAVLGLTGALLHTLNHALFKSLLFLGAGAVVRATGTRQLDELGGLGRRMPLTALAFLVGSVAIVGLPPLNGFVSEWVVLQALLRSGMTPGPVQVAVFAAAGVGLIAALAAACFSRVFGVVFLGQHRASRAAEAAERGPGLLVPMLSLAGACGVLGFAPVVALGPAGRVVSRILPVAWPPLASDVGLGPAALGVTGLAAALAGFVVLVGAVRVLLARGRVPASAATWGCAYARSSARMQYTASSFGAPILSAFGSLAEPPVRRTPTSFRTDPEDRMESRVVRPAWERLKAAATALRPLQQGRVTTYLQYIVWTVLLLLLALFASVARHT